MSFRLLSVALYARDHSYRRDVVFNRSGVSIVTGRSARGKSALLDIVDYCLLSKHCTIPKGVIRNAVSHVGAVFEGIDGRRLSIVRPLPSEGATSTEVYVSEAADLPAVIPEMRWNLDGAKDALSELAGIEAVPLLSNDKSADRESRYPANIRHCAPYLFQPQDVIASRSTTFPGLEDNWVRRHVSDASDYFLGILTASTLVMRRELHALETERNAARRERIERERRSARGWERGLQFWSEAAAAGLVAGDAPGTLPDLFRGLSAASNTKVDTISSAIAEPVLDEVQRAEALLRSTIRQKQYELSELDRLAQTGAEHRDITGTQIARLRIRELLPALVEQQCPLCGNGSLDAAEFERQISEGIAGLEASRAVPKRLSARLDQRRELLRREIQQFSDQLQPLQVQLGEMFQQLRSQRTAREEATRKEHLIGGIREYLSSVGVVTSESDDLAGLDRRIAELEREVGDMALKRQKEAVLETLSQRISALSLQLDVEFPKHAVRLDFESFVIKIKFEQWVRLQELGSGANWLGYHLACLVGLHEYFVMRAAPVPRFIMLDQPSQVWFPAEVAKASGSALPQRDADLAAVKRVYGFLMAAAAEPGAPQIIVSDHARLDDVAFREATIQDWHGEEGLVPLEWL
jgi:hypothetical protein